MAVLVPAHCVQGGQFFCNALPYCGLVADSCASASATACIVFDFTRPASHIATWIVGRRQQVVRNLLVHACISLECVHGE
jgi:hypothetical protein